MEVQPEHTSGEIKRLQRCINDLVSLLALPAIWTGRDPSQVLDTLLDALMRMLHLDLVSVRLKDHVGEKPIEIVRIAQLRGPMPPTHEICDALSRSLSDNSRKWPPLLRNLLGDGDVSIVPLPLGLQSELGVMVVAAEREDFPQQTEALLLSVAANQACIGLQEARLRSQQKRIADELDRRVAERTIELAETNKELQLQVGLLQLLPVSAWTLKPDGTPDFVNQVWLEYSGQTLDFVRSHPEAWMTAVHPEDRETASRSFWDGVRSGQGFAMETRSLRARDGAYRWHLNQAVVLRDAEGKVLKFVGTTTDIDDQKRAEEKLRTSEINLRKIIDNIPGFVATLNPAGVMEHVNRRMLEYYGKTLDEMNNWEFNDTVHPDDLARVTPIVKNSFTNGTPFEDEVRYRRADGIYRWFHVRIVPARDADGTIAGWSALLTDIEDRRRAEEELRHSQAELAHVSRVTSLGAMTASIAHEVNQPLSGIITNASTCLRMLATDPPQVEGARETARRTIRDGNRMSEVITRLRALFSKKEPTNESLNLNDAVLEVIALSLVELQKNRVMLRPELADDLPLVTGDRVQLQQVILNLLRNGSDAMITVEDRPRQLVIRTERDEGDRVRLTVQDAGVGFDPEVTDRLFDAFYTTKGEGMGIGLSVSRSIIERHHGRLWAALNDGPGAAFSFSIPRTPQALARADGIRNIEAPPVAGPGAA
jgi:PAS domain S-box-containing protein